MKRIINLVFDRIERVLWFRHLLWTLRKNDNLSYISVFDTESNSPYRKDEIGQDVVLWMSKHRNDYIFFDNKGKATGTENSTEVMDDKS